MALLMGVACTLGMFAVEARAGSLEMIVTESSGGGPITITDGGALDQDIANVGVIQVNTTLLNALLTNYQFTLLGANSNSPGNAVTGTLTQNGTAQLVLGGTGSITVLASDIDYNSPPAGPGTFHTSATAEFTAATNGNTNTFQGWFNPNPLLPGGMTPPGSPLTTFTAANQPASDPHGGPAGVTNSPITLVNPYGLTNQSVITLTGGTAGALAQDRFGGTVGTFSTAIPEPASMALMLGALPVLVFGFMRRRRAAA